jgi:cytochrome P450
LYKVLRLYPAVPGNRRQAINDDILPDGTPVFAGDEVVFQPFCQGRHEQIWGPDAKEFKPERWFSPDESLTRAEPGKDVGFHSCPRTCLGK